MSTKSTVVEKKYLLPFIVITSLFALWGFANDITNPMVAAFKTVMEISNAHASLIQFAFYGGYATMAIPAALFVQRYSYKKAILLGLALYAIGALLFWPAAQYEKFGFFLISIYILTFGLAFLETTANPFILSLGSKETSTRRLNLAQAFNPMGSLLGMFVASQLVLVSLESDKRNAAGELIFPTLDETAKAAIRVNDLMIIRNPYVVLGLVVIAMLVLIALIKMPALGQVNKIHPWQSFKRLIANKIYREGVIAQVFYVGAQIMCWTFIIQYAENLGINKATAQMYNIVAMAFFSNQPFYLHLPDEIHQRTTVADVLRHRWHPHHQWHHPDRGDARVVLPHCHIGLYVADVPHHLWHCPGRDWRRCHPGRGRTGDGHRGGRLDATLARKHHRPGHHRLHGGCQCVVYPAPNLFCGDRHLRIQGLSNQTSLKGKF